jgi:hypothetical protein
VIAVALWVIAAGVIACACFLVRIILQGDQVARVLEIQIRGLGETHMLGFEALTQTLDRFETRLKHLEDELP